MAHVHLALRKEACYAPRPSLPASTLFRRLSRFIEVEVCEVDRADDEISQVSRADQPYVEQAVCNREGVHDCKTLATSIIPPLSGRQEAWPWWQPFESPFLV